MNQPQKNKQKYIKKSAGIAGFLLPLFLLYLHSQAGRSQAEKQCVEIVFKSSYYQVKIDYTCGMSHYEIGRQYAARLQQALPTYGKIVDSYLSEVLDSQAKYYLLLSRAQAMKQNLPQEYLQEIEGMASVLSKDVKNILGDGALSFHELLMLNLFPDVARASQCTAVAIFGAKTAEGKNLIARSLDWRGGLKKQLAQLHSLTRYIYSHKTLYGIGFLGYGGILTGITENQNLAAILDSPNKKRAPFFWGSVFSYPFDLRYALTNYASIQEIADFMKQRQYSFNHLVFLADPKSAFVLENNLDRRRAVRKPDSQLNSGIRWDEQNAIAAVNSFQLQGNFSDHHFLPLNSKRFKRIIDWLKEKQSLWKLEDLQRLFTYYRGKVPGTLADGDIYNQRTQQIILLDTSRKVLRIFFSPAAKQPIHPIFNDFKLD